MINDRLATHYRIPGVVGSHFRLVDRPENSPYGGILTQAAVQVATADGSATTPVKRGVWVIEHILGKTVPLPPETVEGVEPDLSGKQTILQQLAAHRDSKACRSCHTRIDPYGVAFESFDPMGRYRQHYRSLNGRGKNSTIVHKPQGFFKKGAVVEAHYEMADGRSYKNIQGFKKILLKDRHAVHRAFCEKMFSFALGRELSPTEKLQSDLFSAARLDKGLRSLLEDISTSTLFRGY